eukprot:9360123-Lingulodinium_polyedra.AAC.1
MGLRAAVVRSCFGGQLCGAMFDEDCVWARAMPRIEAIETCSGGDVLTMLHARGSRLAFCHGSACQD